MNSNLPKANAFSKLTDDELWNYHMSTDPQMKFLVEFDDKAPVKVTMPRMVLSAIFWRVFKDYPEAPILPEHYIGSMDFTSKLAIRIMTKICGTIIKTYWGRLDYDQLALRVYQTINDVHNFVAAKLGAYVETIDATDYIEVLCNETVEKARNKVIEANGSSGSIREFYKRMQDILDSPDFLPLNGLVETAKSKSTPIAQILQCIGVRGVVTDINSELFAKPILSGFGQGLTDMADFIIESRSASKAYLFQKEPIRKTEYFNRRLQLLAQPVRYLDKNDCGCTVNETIPWTFEPGDESILEGKYYYDENNELKVVSPNNTEFLKLQGNIIRLRSPLMCRHKHKGMVCSKCLGQLSYTLPAKTNIGHTAAYTIGEKITQAVLSVKHLDASAEIKSIHLDKDDLKYVRLGSKDNDFIYLNESLKHRNNLKLVIDVSDLKNLTQALTSKNIDSLNIYKVSRLDECGISWEHEDAQFDDFFTVSGPSRSSSLTHEFLKYIKKMKYSQTTAKYIEVDLSEWNFELPVFRLPRKQMSMLDFMEEFSKMIETNYIKRKLDPSVPEDLTTYLKQVLEFTYQGNVNIPLMYLEIIALSGLVNSVEENDYRIAHDNHHREFAPAKHAVQLRSVGSALAFEEQGIIMRNVLAYRKDNRVFHPMDCLFYPKGNLPYFKDCK